MKKNIVLISFAFLSLMACSLDEELNDKTTRQKSVDIYGPNEAMDVAYKQLRSFQTLNYQWSLQEHPSDELAGPTRGNDWNDNGKWRALHLMNWTPSNEIVRDTWRELNKGLAYAIDAPTQNLNKSQKAQAVFLESFYIFEITDLFGQVSMRLPGENPLEFPSSQLSRINAIDEAITKLENVLADLPEGKASTADIASKNAGNALLAKMYLNKAVYKATDANGLPTLNFIFKDEDMAKVVKYADAAMSGRTLTTAEKFYDNFSPQNGETSPELIFTSKNTPEDGGSINANFMATLHYNQNPSGWNGFVALVDLYNKFTPDDVRFTGTRTGLTDISGLKTGLLIGQQYDQNGKAVISEILNKNEVPLVFTKEFSLTNSSKSAGIRVIKYYPDYKNINRPDTDFILIRLADVMLMKAEAMARMGNTAGAMTIVNDLRSNRNAPALKSISLIDVLNERARELYWEGHRRRDQIRFKTFLDPVQERSATVDSHVMIYPIPLDHLAVNPNLHQNPGY